MTLFTIGFAGTTADTFFSTLRDRGVRTVYDTRLRTTGQLSGFAKTPDLAYFLQQLADIAYVAAPQLAPAKKMLDSYRAGDVMWDVYAAVYRALLAERGVERMFTASELDRACLLCSEHDAAHCHRSVAAEYLRLHLDAAMNVVHL